MSDQPENKHLIFSYSCKTILEPTLTDMQEQRDVTLSKYPCQSNVSKLVTFIISEQEGT
jgi:hypothetical protein